MTLRVVLALSGALFLGSIGAFFVFVPLVSIASMVSILVGLTVMFWLGVQVGTRGTLAPERAEK
jgi:hypothetical protein